MSNEVNAANKVALDVEKEKDAAEQEVQCLQHSRRSSNSSGRKVGFVGLIRKLNLTESVFESVGCQGLALVEAQRDGYRLRVHSLGQVHRMLTYVDVC
jgi:hypothetical protein